MSKKSTSRPTDVELTLEERACFPIVFDISFDYPSIDRMAGFWEAIGLKTRIITTGAGYALVLYLPDEAD